MTGFPSANNNFLWSRNGSQYGFVPGVSALVCWTGNCGDGDNGLPACPDADADMRLVIVIGYNVFGGKLLFPYHLDFISPNLIRYQIYLIVLMQRAFPS